MRLGRGCGAAHDGVHGDVLVHGCVEGQVGEGAADAARTFGPPLEGHLGDEPVVQAAVQGVVLAPDPRHDVHGGEPYAGGARPADG